RGVAGTALEVAAAEVAVGFHVSDHSLDGGSAPQFALDEAEDAALLAGDEDAARIDRIGCLRMLYEHFAGRPIIAQAPLSYPFQSWRELASIWFWFWSA